MSFSPLSDPSIPGQQLYCCSCCAVDIAVVTACCHELVAIYNRIDRCTLPILWPPNMLSPCCFVCIEFSLPFSRFYFPASGQAVVTGVVPSFPRFLPSIFIAHRVQQSHCSSIFHRMLPTHALALSASQFVHKKKSQRIYTSMHSAGLELTKLIYTRLDDNLIRHRGDLDSPSFFFFFFFILRRMGKNKASAHHTSAYFHTRRVSI